MSESESLKQSEPEHSPRPGRLLALWRSVLNQGVEPQFDLETKAQIRFINGLAVACIAICLSYTIGLSFVVDAIFTVPSFIAALLFLTVIIMNHRSYHAAATRLYLLTANFNNFFSADIMGRDSEIYLYFLVIGFAPYIMLRASPWKTRIAWSGLSFSLLIFNCVFEHAFYPDVLELTSATANLAISSRIGTFLAAIATITYLTYSNDALLNELRHQSSRLDKAQRVARLGTFEVNVKNNTVYWSDELYRLYGIIPGPEAKPLDFSHIHPEDREELIQAYKNIRSLEGPIVREYRALKHDGSLFYIRSYMELERDNRGHPLYIIGASQDVTLEKERDSLIRNQEAQIIASSKLSALGEMAGGIAHEINNPLAIIKSRSEQLLRILDSQNIDKERFQQGIENIKATVERIAKIVRGLRSFSRCSENDPLEALDFQQILTETLELCRAKLKHNGIELRVEVDGKVDIHCRPSQISQIIMNLISNAQDAIEPLSDKWIEIRVSCDGDPISLSVTDSGMGIAPATAAKLMQPFFTTKELGKGTGLGLSISKGLAEQHGGRLFLDPSSQHTRFILELPRKRTEAIAA